MSILSLLLALVLIGIVLWLINNILPMDPKIKTIINVLVVIVVIIWLLKALGAWAYLSSFRL